MLVKGQLYILLQLRGPRLAQANSKSHKINIVKHPALLHCPPRDVGRIRESGGRWIYNTQGSVAKSTRQELSAVTPELPALQYQGLAA